MGPFTSQHPAVCDGNPADARQPPLSAPASDREYSTGGRRPSTPLEESTSPTSAAVPHTSGPSDTQPTVDADAEDDAAADAENDAGATAAAGAGAGAAPSGGASGGASQPPRILTDSPAAAAAQAEEASEPPADEPDHAAVASDTVSATAGYGDGAAAAGVAEPLPRDSPIFPLEAAAVVSPAELAMPWAGTSVDVDVRRKGGHEVEYLVPVVVAPQAEAGKEHVGLGVFCFVRHYRSYSPEPFVPGC